MQEENALDKEDLQKINEVVEKLNALNASIIKPPERIAINPKIVEAKERACKLVSTLKSVQKKIKRKTKNSEKVIKVAEAFIRCHATNPVVYDKYKALQSVMATMGNYDGNTEEA